ncbi:ribbon-helix-helix domain-containing protein [Nocardioides panaciterrulae]|uniref:Uncharacterized protein n=1 Tax=Nocardioides panaciterrulae TaxID=661492 RepID=A0A7Y9E410_9ACTN|nr:ribbon-helix-helix domain-containing protein [Nocardioides panaciterrulae]NYD40848.1 hypothetical protein [Nocardioides panaciterrulae]
MDDVPPEVGSLRTLIVRLTIGSFSLAALLGVVALLGGGAFGSIEGRILLTTLLVGVVSVAVLCHLLSVGTRYRAVGIAGIVAALVPLVSGLFLVWYDYENDVPAALGRTFGVGATVAVTLAQASLLLAVGAAAGPVVRRILFTTLALAAVLALQVSALILGQEPHAPYLRLMGVVAILDVLGTVVVAALARFGAAGRAPRPVPVRTTVALPPDLLARARERADATGRSTGEVVAAAVESYLTDSRVP